MAKAEELTGSAVALMAAGEQQQENPLLEGLLLRRTPDPCALVIFGASGDLTQQEADARALRADGAAAAAAAHFAIVGVSRTEATTTRSATT